MGKFEEARDFLRIIGMPAKQQADLCCYALLAMCNVGESTAWSSATNAWIRIHDILVFTKENFDVEYAENSRETFRKQAMHQFRDAALSEDNSKPTNSPNYRYRITLEALELIKSYKSSSWESKLQEFQANHESLIELYASKKEMEKMPVNINGNEFAFSPGTHNELQKAIIEEFAPRFAPSSECLYVGDSTERDLFKNVEKLWARVCMLAAKKKCILVFAAGNDDILSSVPPENRNASSIVVAAVDKNLYPTDFTNYGPCSDISAPGKDIYSSFPRGGFQLCDGTSMAAPIVTGTIALMKSLKKDLTVQDLHHMCINTLDIH